MSFDECFGIVAPGRAFDPLALRRPCLSAGSPLLFERLRVVVIFMVEMDFIRSAPKYLLFHVPWVKMTHFSTSILRLGRFLVGPPMGSLRILLHMVIGGIDHHGHTKAKSGPLENTSGAGMRNVLAVFFHHGCIGRVVFVAPPELPVLPNGVFVKHCN